MGVIVALLPNRQQLERLRLAIRDRHDIVPCDDWSAVSDECERSPVRVAVIDLFAEGKASFDEIRRLKHRYPRLALIAYVTPGSERIHEIFDAGRYGFESLLIAGQDDEPRRLLAAIEQAEARSLTGRVRQALAHVNPAARDAALLAVTRAHQRLASAAFARLMAMPRRSLAELLERERFPTTQRLLMWGRLIVAGHLLEDTGRSADGIADSLGFPSGSAFRNVCKRYVGKAPNEIRTAGGSAFVIDAFLAELARRRSGQSIASGATDAAATSLTAAPNPPPQRPTPRGSLRAAPAWRRSRRLTSREDR